VSKRIGKMNVKKATGSDGISPKLLHYAKSVVTKPITNLVNLSLSKSTFTKKLLRVSQTSFWSVTIVLFSCSIVSV
jgi:hypothetical protein